MGDELVSQRGGGGWVCKTGCLKNLANGNDDSRGCVSRERIVATEGRDGWGLQWPSDVYDLRPLVDTLVDFK